MSSQELRLRLLGSPVLLLNGNPLEGLPSRAAEALLIYLAFHEQPVSREFLAEFLWGERTQEQALANLRSILSSLRKVAGDHLLVTRQTAAFNHLAPSFVDAVHFEMKMRDLNALLQASPALNAETVTLLEEVLSLYQGDFLEGFYLRDGWGFEEWATLTRERLRRLAHAGLLHLVRHYLETGQYSLGVEQGKRLLSLEPFDEDAQRHMMWLLVRSGQRNQFLRQYEGLKQLLWNELGVEPAPATVALYERLRGISFPPFQALPADPTPFVGRETEIKQLRQLLSTPSTRLITLFGPGGLGKTRLGIEVARQIAQQSPGQFLDGIAFIPLAAVSSPHYISATIAEAIQVKLQGNAPTQEQLLQHLQNKEMLLILDNFEHFLGHSQIEGITLLVEILAKAPQVKLIVTTRERLNLYEETVYDVPGLTLLDLDETHPEKASATALFIQTARRIQHQFSPGTEDLSAIAKTCQLLHGVPLAIELAASWVRQYDCTEIVRQTETSLDFLHTSFRNLPDRHRSLRAVFEHSWDLLTPQEQAIFCQLAIFEGGFTREAVEQVVSIESSVFGHEKARGVKQMTDLWLSSLADKSLIQHLPDHRYTLHPLLRQYAAEKQAEFTGVLDTTSTQYAQYYLDYVAQQGSGESPENRAALQTELANIRAAWLWAIRFFLQKAQPPAVLEKVIPIFHSFYSVQSWFQDGIETFQLAIESFCALPKLSTAQTSLFCDLLGRKARMNIHIGKLDAASQDLEMAQRHLSDVADPAQRSKLIDSLALTYYYAGDYLQATQLGEEILRMAEEASNQEGIAFASSFLGSCAKVLGDYTRAFELFERSLAVYREADDLLGAAMTLNNLGNLAQSTHTFAEARRYYRESSELFKTKDHLHGASTTLVNEGKLALREGDYEAARHLLTESLEIKQKMNDQRGAAVALASLGDLDAETGEHTQARRHLAQALSLAHEAGDVRLVLEILVAVLGLWTQSGNKPPAERLYAFLRQHPALSQEARERLDILAKSNHAAPSGELPLDKVVDYVLKELVP